MLYFFEEIFPEITVIQEILTGVIFGCLIKYSVLIFFVIKDERLL